MPKTVSAEQKCHPCSLFSLLHRDQLSLRHAKFEYKVELYRQVALVIGSVEADYLLVFEFAFLVLPLLHEAEHLATVALAR